MAAITSAAPYLSLLEEHDPTLKSYALKSLNELVDQLWAEIANNITNIEELYEDKQFSSRKLAALLASKVYYNLGDYDSSVKYSLLSGDEFNVNENSEFVETIVSKCIESYIKLSQLKYDDDSIIIDDQLTSIFEQMLNKCVKQGEYKISLGISLESYRLDIVKDIIQQLLKDSSSNEEQVMGLINYVLTCTTTVIENIKFRSECLNAFILILLSLKNPDYFIITKIIVQLNDYNLAHKVFKDLIIQSNDEGDENSILIAYQIAFDLVSVASQELLTKSISILDSDNSLNKFDIKIIRLKKILSGVPTCDFDITFLSNNNHTDISILNNSKKVLDGRSSIFHSAVTFQNAFMHVGTTDDSFFRSNLEWLGKANNWSKFSATAALGVIHKGNLSQGNSVLQPYLPGSTSSPYTNGGSLYGLGLIYAGHGSEVIEFLRKQIVDNSNQSDDKKTDIILHGACLGVGVAAMALCDEEIYEELKTILYTDSAISGESAAYSMGLVMLGSGNESALDDMLTYAQETQHEKIVRALSIGIALICYGKEFQADSIIEKLIQHQDSNLRYGGCFTLALAYCGTSNNLAIKKLLHVAVSDSNDNVRRVAVMCLGFILLRDYTTVPTIVELLSESHNPHVRYGTAMALGISCAGRGLQAAIDVLEPLTKDSVDFVRQGATIAKSMILIQQNEKTFPKIKDFKEQLAKTVSNKHEDSLAKFGAALAQGIIDAGGRNVTIQLENTLTNTLNMKAIVGLTLFTQNWYWYPLTHFLSLSFSPTSIIGIREDLKIPKFKINCHTSPELFSYPPKIEQQVEKQIEKLSTFVLSTTVRAKARAAKKDKAKKEEDKMDIDDDEASTQDKKETTESKSSNTNNSSELSDEEESKKYVKQPYQFENMTRVVPFQLKHVSFIKNDRFIPIRRFRGMSGIVILKDTKPTESIDRIKTIREKYNTEAPIPDPFKIDAELDKELFEDDN
ncbi:hypothetical protein CANARDRAFT_9962 [[Candida] arabinofermentans NRRL YB-2248]|uniref:26S proteasome regulatory subunit RPN2 n=1 Tax=[Candida] arabinofermentans NRRL YB-2248 TaxID=983967 RepID=A0A1E4SUF3_9ASCO|nr:hypothetical protein CANARDRAFT_9962 [[Candida] arabinofermentans NRRL YB-2248]